MIVLYPTIRCIKGSVAGVNVTPRYGSSIEEDDKFCTGILLVKVENCELSESCANIFCHSRIGPVHSTALRKFSLI